MKLAALLPILLLLGHLLAAPTQAAEPLGPEFQANTFEVGDQGGRVNCLYTERRSQDLATDADGNFVVVWESYEQDGDYLGVFAQRFDRFGVKQGDEFRVNSTTAGSQKTPSVAMDANGNFVVVWKSGRYGAEYYGDIFAKRFNAVGNATTAEFKISQSGTTYSYYGYSYTYYDYGTRNPDVEVAANGDFIVVWHAEQYDRNIMARRFGSGPNAKGDPFQVNDDAYPYFEWNEMPDVAVNDGGDFVVVWKALDGYYGGEAILGKRFDSSGVVQGGQFEVFTQPAYDPYSYDYSSNIFETTPVVEMDDAGNFIVAWASSWHEDYLGSYYSSAYTDVVAHAFDNTGASQGPIFHVHDPVDGYQCSPDLKELDDGNYVVTWHNHFVGLATARGQVIDATGARVGPQFSLTEDPNTGATTSAVGAGKDGGFAVAFADNDYYTPNGYDVLARVFGDPQAFCSDDPMPACRGITKAKAGILRYKLGSKPSSNRLTWRLPKLEATAPEDFGNPLDDTDMAVCLYDASANEQPLGKLRAPGGDRCGLIPCWRELSGSAKPLDYIDNFGTPDGLRRLTVRSGAAGRGKINARAKGENQPLLPLPLTPPVIVQLQASNGECWTATYDDFVLRNTDKEFRAKPNAP